MSSPGLEPEPQANRRHLPWHLAQPNYFRCRRILERLKRFQDLIRHKERHPVDVEKAMPLDELLPETNLTDFNRRQSEIEAELNRLIPLVASDLRLANIVTEFSVPADEFDYKQGRRVAKRRSMDLIQEYFYLPREKSEQTYTCVMRILEQGTGAYRAARADALRRMRNPVAWVAWLIRLPVTLLERAGLIQTELHHSGLVAIYQKIAGALILGILILLLTKAGASVPWEPILRFLH